MKRIITIMILVLVGLSACSEEGNLVNSEVNTEDVSLSKQTISESGNSITKTIRNKKGGRIRLKVNLDQSTGTKSTVTLVIPKGALPEKKMDITVTFIPGSPVIEFGPSGIEFLTPLRLDLKLENLWFNKSDQLDFVFLDGAGKKLEDVEYESIIFRSNKNYVKVKKAKISHFSRYGFTR